ncbi:uncharacterized protein [Rhodnius prolixus]|uniref:uncharacterized protein n=1 Tax=Rhodnius prolixus TaxID=13249 RepID=UPI003D187DF8
MTQEISTSTSDYSMLSQISLGAMGDTVLNESSNVFADDEMDSPSTVILPRRENYCFRCRTNLETRARMCRNCYNERRLWMPARPTRKLRKRRGVLGRRRSLLNRYLHFQDGMPSGIQHFNRLSTSSTRSLVSSESSFDFQRGRTDDWRTRKAVMQNQNFKRDFEKSNSNDRNDET